MIRLIAKLPKDRTQLGTISAYVDGEHRGQWPCYGKADNAMAAAKGNPSRNPLKQFGDTPTGTWKMIMGAKQSNTNTYGVHPVIMLNPTGGQALNSYSPDNRRSGIWIHGGSPNRAGGLRPTNGCIRVADEDMVAIHALHPSTVCGQYIGELEVIES